MITKSRLSTLIIFLILCLHSKAINTDDSKKGIAVRGKVSAFFVVEDDFWRNANIGFEFKFLNKHSVGIDYIYFRWRYENDSIVNGIEYSNGYNAFSRRDYINLDYRFYPFKHMLDDIGVDPYVNTFVRFGRRKVWSEDDRTYAKNVGLDRRAVNEQNSNFFDVGLALGMRLGLDNFGVDVNIGVLKRYHHIWNEKGYDYVVNDNYELSSYKYTEWKPHMRLNLYWKFINY